MDYGRLFLFMAAATAVMAIGTHLWCWAYLLVERMVIRRKLSELCQTWDSERLEDEEIERRRLTAPRYQTWEQAMEHFRGGVPLDDVLDRLNGEVLPNASDIQKPGSAAPMSPEALNKAIPGAALATILVTLAVVTCLYGFPSQRFVEELLKGATDALGKPPKEGGA